MGYGIGRVILLVGGAVAAGCGSSVVDLRVVDGVTGGPVAGVGVTRVHVVRQNWVVPWMNDTEVETLGPTDGAGVVRGVRLGSSDRVILGRPGYGYRRVMGGNGEVFVERPDAGRGKSANIVDMMVEHGTFDRRVAERVAVKAGEVVVKMYREGG